MKEKMKKTLLFSNIVGDVTSNENDDLKFNKYMEEFLVENIYDDHKLVFINAPGLGNEENYFRFC